VVARLGTRAARPADLVYNTFDCRCFARSKHDSAPWTLGLLGYCPKLKNPRLAAEILLRLRRHDQRWRLRLTGRPPESYEWVWSNPEERRYYQALEAFIASANLAPHIIREDWTDDPPGWFARVGFILSCSDFEGSHQAVAEGLASGAIPVVHRWPGAADIYPDSLLFDTADRAADLINTVTTQGRWTELSEQARREARQRFDLPVVLPQIEHAVLGRPVTAPAAELLPA
jgi:glycosyltransferase involved in cell wall biosynthesis